MGNPYPADFADDTGQVRLGGEITFTDQANQPGGGSIPDSWLSCYSNAGLTASGNLSWGEGGVQGADLAIDGGDDTLINVLTSGFYAIACYLEIAGDATGAGTAQATLAGTAAGQSWIGAGDLTPTVADKVIPPSYDAFRGLIVPVLKITAPATIQIAVGITATAGAVTLGSGASLNIVRLA